MDRLKRVAFRVFYRISERIKKPIETKAVKNCTLFDVLHLQRLQGLNFWFSKSILEEQLCFSSSAGSHLNDELRVYRSVSSLAPDAGAVQLDPGGRSQEALPR